MSDAALTGQWLVPSSCRLIGANEGVMLRSWAGSCQSPPTVPMDRGVQQLRLSLLWQRRQGEPGPRGILR